MKKITDPKLLKELYDTEADWKLLIGYRFKGSLGSPRRARRRTKSRLPATRRNGRD
jgi:hypothetical protein